MYGYGYGTDVTFSPDRGVVEPDSAFQTTTFPALTLPDLTIRREERATRPRTLSALTAAPKLTLRPTSPRGFPTPTPAPSVPLVGSSRGFPTPTPTPAPGILDRLRDFFAPRPTYPTPLVGSPRGPAPTPYYAPRPGYPTPYVPMPYVPMPYYPRGGPVPYSVLVGGGDLFASGVFGTGEAIAGVTDAAATDETAAVSADVPEDTGTPWLLYAGAAALVAGGIYYYRRKKKG